MILIVGSEGAQGKRYQAILRYLGKDFRCVDMGMSAWKSGEVCEGIILATPTASHVQHVIEWAHVGVPFLIEKPFSKDVAELKDLRLGLPDLDFSMVMQYRHLAGVGETRSSHYDYFRHGSDGLVWDCLQIIALAKGSVSLSEESPVWDCAINGDVLDIREMDGAYVSEVDSWLHGHRNSWQEIIDIHEKVADYAKSH